MKHFDIKEFDSPDLPGSASRYMDKKFLDLLDNARSWAKTPFIINSGYRTPEHNGKIKGSPTSSHMKGLAVDIACDNSLDRFNIIDALLGEGFTRIGVANTFIHVDIDKSKPDAIWLY